MAQIVGDAALARHYGVSAKTVYNWRQAGMPCTRTATGYTFDTAKTDPFVAGVRRSSESDRSSGDVNERIKEEKLKQLRIKTAGMTAALQKEMGELLPRRAWELFGVTLLTALGDWCDQLPEILAGECCPKCRTRIPERLKDELNRRREEVADELQHGPATTNE